MASIAGAKRLIAATTASSSAPRAGIAVHATPLRPACLLRASACSLCRPAAPSRSATRLVTACSAAASNTYADSPVVPVTAATGERTQFPAVSGIYAVHDAAGTLQYIGLSRKVAVSVATHLEALPELVHSVKVLALPNAGKDELTDAWRQWIEEAVEATGVIPPGNAQGEKSWQQRRVAAAKPEIRLTPGKGIQDLNCAVTDLIEAVVKGNRVVAFVKGTRTAPQCGFSHKVLTMLAEVAGKDFEVVNVLDDVYNPGLREAIKEYSQWPTIPQVYVGGEFVGGADILEQMHGSGELTAMLAAPAPAAAPVRS